LASFAGAELAATDLGVAVEQMEHRAEPARLNGSPCAAAKASASSTIATVVRLLVVWCNWYCSPNKVQVGNSPPRDSK
jgi:hypothetical protein